MDSARTAAPHFETPNRVVVDLAAVRPPKRPTPKPAPALKPNAAASNAFASKLELGAQVAAALAAEAACLTVPLPENLCARLAKLEAEFELAAHDVRDTGGVA
jgi:hypothetical protein